MTKFYCRFWLKNGNVKSCSSRMQMFEKNNIEVDADQIIDCEVEGEYVLAGDLLPIVSFADGEISIECMSILSQEPFNG